MSGQILTVHWWPHANGGLCFTFWLSHPKINLRPRNDIINSFSSSHHLMHTAVHCTFLSGFGQGLILPCLSLQTESTFPLSNGERKKTTLLVIMINEYSIHVSYQQTKQSSHACIKSHCMHYLMLFFLKKTMLVIFSGFEFF